MQRLYWTRLLNVLHGVGVPLATDGSTSARPWLSAQWANTSESETSLQSDMDTGASQRREWDERAHGCQSGSEQQRLLASVWLGTKQQFHILIYPAEWPGSNSGNAAAFHLFRTSGWPSGIAGSIETTSSTAQIKQNTAQPPARLAYHCPSLLSPSSAIAPTEIVIYS
jgi:hypothetical protein